MNYEIGKAFQKEFFKLKNKKLAVAILTSIEEVAKAKDTKDIPNLKKLQGHKTAHRIRVGNYRIGYLLKPIVYCFNHLIIEKIFIKNFPKR